MTYPKSYHAACTHLIAFGGHRFAAAGRVLVARALRDLRRERGHAFARDARRGMRFISGHFPVKGD
jgi:hypothetical protein